MQPESLDALQFGRYRKIDGSIARASIGRRNGKPAIFFPPDIAEPAAPADPAPDFWEQERLFVNLTPIERKTWRKILTGQSIATIAKEEGVFRSAIYARIEGNSKGQGGMISKNVWCLLWWRLRQKLFNRESHV